MNNLDTTLYNLRPRPATPSFAAGGYAPPSASNGLSWGPRTWRLIDQQMRLKECTIYRYAPDEYDLFEEDEEGSIWSMNYFFFNKALKRVCYLYLRGISVLSQPLDQDLRTPVKSTKRFADEESDGWVTPELGARKRARYWLGDREGVEVAEHDDEYQGDPSRDDLAYGLPPTKRPLVDEHDNYILSDEDARSARSRSKSTVRGVSEDIAEAMEV
jgi:Maf1 regulator